jgi:hypothetical protein
MAEQRHYRDKLLFLQLKFDAGPFFLGTHGWAISAIFSP